MGSKSSEYINRVESIKYEIDELNLRLETLMQEKSNVDDIIDDLRRKLSKDDCENNDELADLLDDYILLYREITDKVRIINNKIDEETNKAYVIYDDVIKSIRTKIHNNISLQGGFGKYNEYGQVAISRNQRDINDLNKVLVILGDINNNFQKTYYGSSLGNIIGSEMDLYVNQNTSIGSNHERVDLSTVNLNRPLKINSAIGKNWVNTVTANIFNKNNNKNNSKELDIETKYEILKTVVRAGEKLDANTKYRYVMSHMGREYLQATYGWSSAITNNIRRIAEADIYANANLKEVCINGNYYLIPEGFSLSWHTQEGKSNLILLSGNGKISDMRNPVDNNGEKIYYHHIGQKQDSPIALLSFKYHGSKESYSELHDTNVKESEIDRKEFNVQKKEVINNDLLSHFSNEKEAGSNNSNYDANIKSNNDNLNSGGTENNSKDNNKNSNLDSDDR